MARLGDRVGIFGAFAWATFLTAAIAFALLLVVHQGAGEFVAAARQPLWLWSGGVIGVLIVLTITFSGARIGRASCRERV